MWEQIEAVVSHHELAAAIAALFELTPPLDSDADEAWRAMLVTRFGAVRPFLKLLVLAAPHLEPGTVDWKAYVLCALEQFHRMLRRREVFAKNSSKWGDPRAKVLAGEA